MEEENKKTTFLFVFSTYLPVFLLKFRSGELLGCEIKFRIQQVPIGHTFNGPNYPKNNKYPKNVMNIIIMFFHIFLVLRVEESVKSMPSGYLLDAEFYFASMYYILNR